MNTIAVIVPPVFEGRKASGLAKGRLPPGRFVRVLIAFTRIVPC
jgi:hypothetical protein